MKKTVLALAALLISMAASAIPAMKGVFRYTQPDGSTVQLERHGDEFFHWTTLAGSGRAVELDAGGFWREVSLDPVQARSAVQRRREAAVQRRSSDPMTHGSRHIPVLLVNFSDKQFSVSGPNDKFTDLLNQEGYSANGGTGSVRDFYVENSHGVFEPVFDVYGPVDLSRDMAFYGKNSNGSDAHPEVAVYDAALLLDSDVDFSRYDYDNDGSVAMILMYYAGHNQAEGGGEFLHLGVGHPFRLKAHLAGGDVDEGGLVQDVHLVEGAHNIVVHRKDAVLFPHHHVIPLVEGPDGSVGKGDAGRQHIRDHSEPPGTEGLGLGNHRPEHPGGRVFFHPFPAVGEGHQFDGVGMHAGAVRRPLRQQVVMDAEVGREFGGRGDGAVGDDLIVGAVPGDADDGAVLHRAGGEVPHPAVGALAVEPAALQVREGEADGTGPVKRRKGAEPLVHPFGDVDGDVAAVALGPSDRKSVV